jgi:YhcH/YjgK/YiaL family protein
MIIDSVANAEAYTPLGGRIAAGLEYLRRTDLVSLEAGRYGIDGEAVYAVVQDYTTCPAAGKPWEAHRAYIDIQYVAAGAEMLGWAPVEKMTQNQAYDPAKDVAFFEGTGDFLRAGPGTFLVFFPRDAHMPGVQIDAPAPVRKVVVKVAASAPDPRG